MSYWKLEKLEDEGLKSVSLFENKTWKGLEELYVLSKKYTLLMEKHDD